MMVGRGGIMRVGWILRQGDDKIKMSSGPNFTVTLLICLMFFDKFHYLINGCCTIIRWCMWVLGDGWGDVESWDKLTKLACPQALFLQCHCSPFDLSLTNLICGKCLLCHLEMGVCLSGFVVVFLCVCLVFLEGRCWWDASSLGWQSVSALTVPPSPYPTEILLICSHTS